MEDDNSGRGLLLEQLGPIPRLAALGIFDLDPRGRRNVGAVRSDFPLRDDPFESSCAHGPIEIASARLGVVREENERPLRADGNYLGY